MKVLVTGANGQLGLTMRQVAESCTYHHFTFFGKNQLDITDSVAVRRAVSGVDVVLNCAAYTNVERAETEPKKVSDVNIAGVANLAAAAAEENALLIHVSSDYIFGDSENRPIAENASPAPLNVYGKTKWEGEQVIQRSGCRHIIIRTSWLFSPFGKNFVSTMLGLMSSRSVVQVVTDQVGCPTYTEDLAEAILTIINSPVADSGIYHYSNEGVCSWYDFAVAIAGMSGTPCTVNPCFSRDFGSKVVRPPYSVLDKTKIRAAFNLNIPHWFNALQRCIKKQQAYNQGSHI